MKYFCIISMCAMSSCAGEDNLKAGAFTELRESWQLTSVSGALFPLVLSPAEGGLYSDPNNLMSSIEKNKRELLQAALDHGAILFRGFPVDNPTRFAELALSLGLEEGTLEGSAAPRSYIHGTKGAVFTANESPPERNIPFHHEMAQTAKPPAYILFYCEEPAASGGATPIVLSQEVGAFAQKVHPDFTNKLRERGVQYHRTLPATTDLNSSLGKSWRETFNVTTRAQAEAFLRQPSSGYSSWHFLESHFLYDEEGSLYSSSLFEDADLRTTTSTHAALAVDPRTGEEVFFNQLVAAYTGWSDVRNEPESSVTFGLQESSDPSAVGEPLDREAMMDIAHFMQTRRVAFPWQKGDVLLIDNRQTMHSRDPFTLHGDDGGTTCDQFENDGEGSNERAKETAITACPRAATSEIKPNRRILTSVWGRAKPPPEFHASLEASSGLAASAVAAFVTSPTGPLSPFLLRRYGGGGGIALEQPQSNEDRKNNTTRSKSADLTPGMHVLQTTKSPHLLDGSGSGDANFTCLSLKLS